jgi:DNA repair exonuclease SbcCD nuclease subunit
VKLAHLADLHLGFRQFDRQTPRGGNQREKDVADAFGRAVDDLLEQRPDLIVIAGDVFHSVRPTNPAILFLFQQLQRLRAGLPDAPIVVVAGEHDTPRSAETGAILKLYEVLGVELALDAPRRIVFPTLDCSVLAVPHQALAQAERPALRPDAGSTTTLSVLVTHGDWPGAGEARGTKEYGGADLSRHALAPAQWDYVALGHYHVAQRIEANVCYAGALEYVSPNPWGQLDDERERREWPPGKGYLLVELPGARVTFRPISAARQVIDLSPVQGAGLSPKELDAEIAKRVAAAKPAIDDQVVRLRVYDVERATARDLDHAGIRSYKTRALNFQLDIRRPEAHPTAMPDARGRRLPLSETLREFLRRRPLDAGLDRDAFVRLGVEMLERAGGEED